MSKRTSDALEILHRRERGDRELRAMVNEELLNAEIAQLIYDARTAAGLTQKELADLVATSQPAVARLEDGDYEGHSLSMLRRIATALDMRLELRFVPEDDKAA